MPYLVEGASRSLEDIALANMFRERKRVFIDLLGWDIPSLAGTFEVDQFDGVHTTYLVLARHDGAHLGSMRLLPSEQPNVLGSLFPFLCDEEPPADPQIWEISRFCLSRDLRAHDRRMVRNQLITTAVRFALDNDIAAFFCVADTGWLSQIPFFGWHCELLGNPQQLPCGTTGAMRIDITPETPSLMAAAGTWMPSSEGSRDVFPVQHREGSDVRH
ncbi:acyl-homoserine-lactone synthase [Flavisphingomonas formosensis]|uniref:acyl-homoserine-lactone synthase n=1 Tax=Flavisphingomonas formosensis TaxID=861534 RepID=UPI0012F8EBD1|nr:acyl-homoserine-lactone synthase [Sphingomonas formosensis]